MNSKTYETKIRTTREKWPKFDSIAFFDNQVWRHGRPWFEIFI